MSSFYDDASLVVIPSGYKTSKVYAEKPTDGSGDLAFTRTGDTATRVNSAGLIEKVRTNLLVQSQNLAAAAWSLGGTATRTANYGTAPDGTQTSTRIQWTAAASFELYQYTGFAVPVYGSVYIKGTNGQTIKYTGNSVTLNGSWQRIEGAIAIDGANTYFTISGTAGTNTAFDFQLWGAQAERGDIATAYIPTTTAAVSVGPVANVPRLDYLGSTCPRLILEPQRTNKITYSENQGPTGTNWYPSTTWTVTNNTVTSPSGYQDADTLTETTSTDFHSSYYNATIESSYTGTYTISAFAKYNGRLFVLNPFSTAAGRTYFNLQTGTVLQAGTGVTAKIENYGNGWYRCICTASFSSQIVAFEYMLASAVGTPQYTGNGTSGVHIWGCMAEAGAYATSYIPTLAASATRGADTYQKGAFGNTSTAGTFFCEFEATNINSANGMYLYGMGVGTTDTLGNSYATNSGSLSIIANGDVLQGKNNGYATDVFIFTPTAGATVKIAMRYDGTNVVAFVNGVKQTVYTDNAVGVKNFIRVNNAEQSSHATKQILFFPSALTDAQLIELTTL